LKNLFIDDVLNKTKDLKQARQLLGQLIHTLQDFYSHSNWVELNKTDINERIGIYEDIGLVAEKNQSTCTNEGCTEIEVKCVRKKNRFFFKNYLFLFLKEFMAKNNFKKLSVNIL
jgi:hypothetical protein